LHKLLSANSGDKIDVQTLKQSLADSLGESGTLPKRRKYEAVLEKPKETPLWYSKLKQSTK